MSVPVLSPHYLGLVLLATTLLCIPSALAQISTIEENGTLVLDGTSSSGTRGPVTTSLIDPLGGFAYFGTKNLFVIRVRLDTFQEEEPALNLGLFAGIPQPTSALIGVMDADNGVMYFSTRDNTLNSGITWLFKIDLATFTVLAYGPWDQYGLEQVHGMFVDLVGKALIGIGNPPIGDQVITNSITRLPLNETGVSQNYVAFVLRTEFAGVDAAYILSGFLDSQENFGYFADDDASGRIYKLNLDVAALEAEVPPESISIDPHGNLRGVAYDLTKRTGYFFSNERANNSDVNDTSAAPITPPSKIVKFDVDSFSLIDVLTLSANVREAATAVIDTTGGQLYIGTDDSRIAHVSLKRFTTVGAGINLNSTENLRSSVIDTANRHAYFAATPISLSLNTRIVRVSLPLACPNDCNGRGTCDYETCNCTAPLPADLQLLFPNSPGWSGAACTTIGCPNDCSGRGLCANGTCQCEDIWTGDSCEIRQCPNNCFSHGTCDEGFVCACDPGYTQDDCSNSAPLPCEYYSDCNGCSANSSCGWCDATSTCLYGDIRGPNGGGCLSWHYRTCPEIGLNIFAYLFTAFFVILMLVNVISVCVEDYHSSSVEKPVDTEIRSSWWRNQRSAKTWALVDQMQFGVLTTQFAVHSPTLYNNFVGIFRWSMIGFPLPWSINKTPTPPARELLSFEQWNSSTLAYDTEVFFGSLFWLVLLLAAFALFFGIVFLVGVISGSSMLKDFCKFRAVYVANRILLFIFLPFSALTAYTLTRGGDSVGAALVAALFLILLIGGMAYTYLIVPKNKRIGTSMFTPSFLKRFGPLFHPFKVKVIWFTQVILVKKILLGLTVGFLHKLAVPQLVVVELILVGYLVALMFLNPYLDPIHKYLDLCNSVTNILVVALMFAFIDSVNDLELQVIFAGIIAGLLLLTHVLCIAAFVNSWLRLNGIHTFKHFINYLTNKREEPAADDIELSTNKVE